MQHKSCFGGAPDIVPPEIAGAMSVSELVRAMGKTCFEARNVYRGAKLYQRMIDEGDTVWLGIAGAGIAGGMGGMVASLINAGFVDVICSTGAQVYHDLHFAFGLPVKAICPHSDDEMLRKHGDTRIYDVGIREEETLKAQDEIIRRFVNENRDELCEAPIASWEFNAMLGRWTAANAPHPDKSFVAAAATAGVPIFWDSLTNHSIAMNLLRCRHEGNPVTISHDKDIFDSAAIAYGAGATGFVELGGGGPKNFVQQTGPTLSQILGIDFEGADRGLQISTTVEREGSLSSCTFGEAVTWGKYQHADDERLVQIWAEYSIVFPMLAAYVIQECSPREKRGLVAQMETIKSRLEDAV